MPSINLIAARREEKRRVEQHIRRLIWAIVAECGLILLVASLMVAKIVTEHGQISQLDGQIGVMQSKVDQIQNLEQATAQLKPKVGLLNGARNNTLYWYTALQTVVACLPQQAWLTTIGTGGDPLVGATPPATGKGSTPAAAPAGPPAGGPNLTFSGQAANSDEVGLAMLKMNQFANISNVTLSSVTESTSAGASTMQFSMAVQLKPNTAADSATPLPVQNTLPQAAGASASRPIDSGGTPVRQATTAAPMGEVNHA